MSLKRLTYVGLVAGLGLALTGCGGTVPVSGKVIYQGKAANGGAITLIGSDGIAYTEVIKEDGSFDFPAAPSGNVKIGLTSPRPVSKDKTAPGRNAGGGREPAGSETRSRPAEEAPPPPPPKPTGPPPVLFDSKYSDPTSSGLTGVVKAGVPLSVNVQ